MQFLLLPKPICAHNDHRVRCDQDAVWGAFSDEAPGQLLAVLCGYHRRKWDRPEALLTTHLEAGSAQI